MRNKGWYSVVLDGKETIAEWIPELNLWVTFKGFPYHEGDFDEIGEQRKIVL